MDKKTVIQMLQADFSRIHEESKEITKNVEDMKQDALDYIDALLAQLTATGTASLLAKTPKVPKKRTTRIKAIPENDELETSDDGSNPHNSMSTRSSRMNTMVLETSVVSTGRAKRGASVKAADIIKKQQSVTLNTKLRRPSNDGSDVSLAERLIKDNRPKRPKESIESSEDEDARPVKQSKVETKKSEIKDSNKTYNAIAEEPVRLFNANETYVQEKHTRASTKRKFDDQCDGVNDNTTFKRSTRQSSLLGDEPVAKKANYSKSSPEKKNRDSKSINKQNQVSDKTISMDNKKSISSNTSSSSMFDAQSSKKINKIINETIDTSHAADETVASMYEDAIGKPIPIMNSTMNPNTTVTLEKMMNVTVLIEPLSTKKVFNETVTVKKASFKEPLSRSNSTIKEKVPEEELPSEDKASATFVKEKQESENAIISKSQRENKINKFNNLLTDDESSPERKEYKAKKGKVISQQKRITRSSSSLISEDEILRTPLRINPSNKDMKGSALKSGYKQPILFSPYAKDSVKKRVEAFEQVAVSPKQPETAGRITRTKTRALAAATETPAPTVSQKLARKSLAKAKKISLAKRAKESDDTKENENTNVVKSTKSSSLERSAQKPSGKTTPLGKTRMLQMPSSVTKNTYATPSNSQYLNPYSKSMTAPRGNIVANVDSFIQPIKSASKQIDRAAEEKRRRAHEEDARRKREEFLKAQADEKRRKREEKELKNKLAREAKEKLDYEKRLKAEKEREEKAKLAQQMQEKQKEEMERKRMAAMQRAQEKEERRKQEELQRLQRLQEQEEQERLLAEQRRREQEMEKRKQAEMRQQMVEIKLKNQMDKALQQAKTKAMAQKQVPCSYKIDSDPDEEESDDESKPKHKIPHWASKNVRQTQLAMQQHIPLRTILRFFDSKKCTPDLRELFRGIDPKKLKRSSSAIWKTPPRYSMMNCSIIKD